MPCIVLAPSPPPSSGSGALERRKLPSKGSAPIGIGTPLVATRLDPVGVGFVLRCKVSMRSPNGASSRLRVGVFHGPFTGLPRRRRARRPAFRGPVDRTLDPPHPAIPRLNAVRSECGGWSGRRGNRPGGRTASCRFSRHAVRCFPCCMLYSALPRMNLMNSLPCSTTGKVVAMPMRTAVGRGITSWGTGDAQPAPVESGFREGRLTTRAAAPTSECCSGTFAENGAPLRTWTADGLRRSRRLVACSIV